MVMTSLVGACTLTHVEPSLSPAYCFPAPSTASPVSCRASVSTCCYGWLGALGGVDTPTGVITNLVGASFILVIIHGFGTPTREYCPERRSPATRRCWCCGCPAGRL